MVEGELELRLSVFPRQYAFGGTSLNKEALSSGEVFDPELGRWEALPPMPEPRAGACIAVLLARDYSVIL